MQYFLLNYMKKILFCSFFAKKESRNFQIHFHSPSYPYIQVILFSSPRRSRAQFFLCLTAISKVNTKSAPAHIRQAAEYVGALVYRFNSTENFVNALYGTKFLTAVEDKDKPALCVVKN